MNVIAASARALADLLHPLEDGRVGVEGVARGDADVGGDGQHLLEALPLVEVVAEAEPGLGDGRQRLAPPEQVDLGRRPVLVVLATPIGIGMTFRRAYATDRLTPAIGFGARDVAIATAAAVTLLGRLEFPTFAILYFPLRLALILPLIGLYGRVQAPRDANPSQWVAP